MRNVVLFVSAGATRLPSTLRVSPTGAPLRGAWWLI